MTRFGACILSCDGPRLTENEKALFADVKPLGFILFARHVETPDQIRALCAEMREAAGHDALITIDQEGGRVQRLTGPTWRDWHPPLDDVTRASDPIRAMYIRSRIIAHELHALGIDSNCAPTLDIIQPGTHPFLRNRCYGSDPEKVSAIGRAVTDGFLDGGVLPVMKHMPGHGRSKVDTHFDLPKVTEPQTELSQTDFAPFRALNDLPLGMTAHLVFQDIDDAPATLSPKMIETIRTDIGFDGLLMTDDISMQALSGTLAERSKASIAAGVDVILHCNDTFEDRVAVAEGAGQISDAGQARADAAFAPRKPPNDIDIPALEAELEALLGGPIYV
ncbi:MAG: glycoside hydrolase family 3 protein [Pseudomonadota bacterium]